MPIPRGRIAEVQNIKGGSFYDKERMKDLLAYDDLHPGSKRGNVSSSVVAGYALQ